MIIGIEHKVVIVIRRSVGRMSNQHGICHSIYGVIGGALSNSPFKRKGSGGQLVLLAGLD